MVAVVTDRDAEIRAEFIERMKARHGAHAALAAVYQRTRQAERAVKVAAMPEAVRTALLGDLAAIDSATKTLAERVINEQE